MLVEDANDVEDEHTVEDGLTEVMEVLRHAPVAPAVLGDREVALGDGVERLSVKSMRVAWFPRNWDLMASQVRRQWRRAWRRRR